MDEDCDELVEIAVRKCASCIVDLLLSTQPNKNLNNKDVGDTAKQLREKLLELTIKKRDAKMRNWNMSEEYTKALIRLHGEKPLTTLIEQYYNIKTWLCESATFYLNNPQFSYDLL